jgi:hypothetical protein
MLLTEPSKSRLEGRTRKLDLGSSSIVDEPVELARLHRAHAARGKALLWLIEDCLERIRLALASRNECDARSVVDHRVREGDPARRRLGRVFHPGHPAILLGEERVPREQRRGVPVRTKTEEDQVKDGEARGVCGGKLLDKLLLVRIGEVVEVVEQGNVQRVNVFGWDRNFGEKLRHAKMVIAVLIVERDGALVSVEDVPTMRCAIEVRLCLDKGEDIEDRPLVPFDAGLVDKPVELLGQRASGNGNGKVALLFNRLFLCPDNECREGVDELVGRWECEQDRRLSSRHCTVVIITTRRVLSWFGCNG